MSWKDRVLGALRRERIRHKAILFADIVSSTALYEAKGDREARAFVAARLAELAATAKNHRGRVLKELGDGILCDFAEPRDAFGSGLEMTAARPAALEVRVGMHFGEVIERSRDIFGDAVNTAARIASIAKPSELLISAPVLAALPAGSERLVQAMPPIAVKGKAQPLELFAAVRFGHGDAQVTLPTLAARADPRSDSTLELTWRGQTRRIEAGTPKLTLGRQSDNDLVVDLDRVSRHHAVVYLRAGKLVLADQSANGTWLVPTGGASILLQREETILHGEGTIFLGIEPEMGEGVRYRISRAE